MKYYLVDIFLFASLLAGCGANPEQNSKAINGFTESCQGNITAEFHISATGNDITLKCDKFVAPTKIEPSRQTKILPPTLKPFVLNPY